MQDIGKVSVVIPNYNYAKYVGAAINSVLAQSYSNLEIIVVNNGSTDHSIEVLDAFGDKIVLISQENLGQSGARNSGLRKASGDFIAFLDADDTWHPEKLEKQLKLINSKVELVYCGIRFFDESVNESTGLQQPSFRGQCSRDFLDHPAVSIVLSGESTSLITRALLEKVGLFDSELNSAGGWDFFRRCSKFTEFDFVAESLTDYRLHNSNMSKSIPGSISDIRLAYKKLFEDKNWKLSKLRAVRIILVLEKNFVKTYLKNRNFIPAIVSPLLAFKKGTYR